MSWQAVRYRWETAAPSRRLAEEGDEVAEMVADWPKVARALDLLSMGTDGRSTPPAEELQHAAVARGTDTTGPPTGVGAACALLRAPLGDEDTADLTARRARASKGGGERLHVHTYQVMYTVLKGDLRCFAPFRNLFGSERFSSAFDSGQLLRAQWQTCLPSHTPQRCRARFGPGRGRCVRWPRR